MTLAAVAADLAAGRVRAAELVEDALRRIEDPAGEGRRAFLTVDADAARAAAAAMDGLRAVGLEPTPYAGIPVSVKDLFDVRGQVTRAGSTALDRGPADADADAVASWRRAGLISLGRTNMTEFAYGGIGINPHYGTPKSPWDRERGRIPGGSTGGGAVAVADGMAFGALGSDTGGSCRIPAAFCGVTGLKPTASHVSRRGSVPLADALDSVGVIGRSVACCGILYDLLRGASTTPVEPVRRPPRLGVPGGYLMGDTDADVGAAFERALGRLAEAGAALVEVDLPELEPIPEVLADGGFTTAESFAWHEELLASRGAEYDPRIRTKIERGRRQTARDLLALHEWRRGFVAAMARRFDGLDGLAFPTVPIVPPPLDAFAADEDYVRLNLLVLRNSTVVNLFDGCAISLPMEAPGEPPAGLTLALPGDRDAELLRVAAWVEERL
jgi:aspartyl-tRNA(Asn)/glutamyl-tRNA(Gln) amidotransferase subunit A